MTLCMERVVDQTDHFIDAFFGNNVTYCYDVQKLTVNAILFSEIQ